jgi:hypothetical protein
MRTLAVDEVGFVSGGELDEVVVTASRIVNGLVDPDVFARFAEGDGGRGGGVRGPWWVVALALLADEAKDLLEEYVKERAGYETLQELLKAQMDEALRCGHPAGHAGLPLYYDPLPGCGGG